MLNSNFLDRSWSTQRPEEQRSMPSLPVMVPTLMAPGTFSAKSRDVSTRWLCLRIVRVHRVAL